MSDAEGPSGRGHRVLPHTADVIVEAWAPSRNGCLEELVRGLAATFTDVAGIAPTAARSVEIDAARAARDDDALVALLDEVCFLLDTEGMVVVDIVLEAGAKGALSARLSLAPLASVEVAGAAPKGVSRSELRFGTDGAQWRAHVIVDV